MPTAQDVLIQARSLLGIAETPPGSNIVHPILDWFGEQGIQWCAATVAYVFFHVDPALVHNVKSSYSGDYLAAGRKYGEEIHVPAPGAICIMDYATAPGGITDHIGVTESVSGSTFVNIEGNHNNRVERVTRHLGDGNTYWFILPKYSTPTPKGGKEQMLYEDTSDHFRFIDCFQAQNAYWLHVHNPNQIEVTITLLAIPEDGKPGATVPLEGMAVAPTSHGAVSLNGHAKAKGVTGSFVIDAKATASVEFGLREIPN